MTISNNFKEIAYQALLIPNSQNSPNNYLIDRAQCILHHCHIISQLPEVIRFQIDKKCLQIAALFNDTGFAKHITKNKKNARMVITDLSNEDQRDFSAQFVNENLADFLKAPQLERVCNIILASNNRNTSLVEAMILSDARNITDMGNIGVFNDIRKNIAHGRSVTDVTKSWTRKIEYDYWTAMLRDSFRFKAVRSTAKKRLAHASAFMEMLEQEKNASDLAALIPEQEITTDHSDHIEYINFTG